MLKKLTLTSALLIGVAMMPMNKAIAAAPDSGFEAVKALNAGYTKDSDAIMYRGHADRVIRLLVTGTDKILGKPAKDFGITSARDWFPGEEVVYKEAIAKAARATYRGGVQFDKLVPDLLDPVTKAQCMAIQQLYNAERTKLGLTEASGACLNFVIESEGGVAARTKPRLPRPTITVPVTKAVPAAGGAAEPDSPPPPPPPAASADS